MGQMQIVLIAGLLFGTVALQAQAPTYRRGEQVRIQSSDGKPASPSIQRIVAIPGDRLRADKTGVYVNDEAVAGISPELLGVIGKWEQSVPVGHYFVVGEKRQGPHSVTRASALLPASRILGRVRE
jgi:hypothetical protein